MKRILVSLFTLTFISLLSLAPAQAAILEYTFTANFVSASLDDTLDSAVDEAASQSILTGSILFSLGQGFLPNSPEVASYSAPIVVFDQLTNSNFNVAPNVVLVANNVNSPAVDAIASGFTPLSAAGLQNAFNFGFRDASATALSSTDFPLLIELSDFAETVLQFSSALYDSDGSTILSGESASFVFTSFEPLAVASPFSLLIMLLGISAMLMRRQRNQNDISNI